MAKSPVRPPRDVRGLVDHLGEIERVVKAWRAGDLAPGTAAHRIFFLAARAVRAVGDCHR